MKNWIKVFSEHQIILSIAIVIVFGALIGVTYFTSDLKQEAAVVRPGSCYLQSDIDKKLEEKKSIQESVVKAPEVVKAANEAIAANSKAIATLKNDSTKLQRAIKSDYTISTAKKKVDDYAAKVEALKASGRSRAGTVASMETTLRKELTSYNKLVADNDANKAKLEAGKIEQARLEGLQIELNQKLTDAKNIGVDAKTKIALIDVYVKTATARLCKPTEAICNNVIDDDRDGVQDCDDGDCSSSPLCKEKQGSEAQTVTTACLTEENGYIADCKNPACKDDPYCIASKDVTKTNEICDNLADDDGDSLADCADTDCKDDPVCKSNDGEGKIPNECPDSDYDGVNDVTGEACSKSGPTSCDICEYSLDFKSECFSKYPTACDAAHKTGQCSTPADDDNKRNVFKSYCPNTARSFSDTIIIHSCALNFSKATGKTFDAMSTLSSWNIKWDETKDATIKIMDIGCHSLGGLYSGAIKDQADANFKNALLHYQFEGTIMQGGNQTYGNVDLGIRAPGYVIFAGRPSHYPIFAKDFANCPSVGDKCYAPKGGDYCIMNASAEECLKADAAKKPVEQEQIMCGDAENPSTYFCNPGTTEEYGLFIGTWKKSSLNP